jgi:prophage maintenance system killer protein
MKFTKLEKNFLENYNRNFDKSTKQDGISIMTDGKMFFIPITSPKKKHNHIKPHDSKYHCIIDSKNKLIGVLKISDYIYCGKFVINYEIENPSIMISQFEIIKKDKNKIERKLLDCQRSGNYLNSNIKFYDSYCENIKAKSVQFSKNFVENIIFTLSKFENYKYTYEQIESIVKYNGLEIKIDTFELAILQDSRYAWQNVMDNLNSKLTLEYIIQINNIVASKQALKTLTLRDEPGGYVVGSDYSPKIPDPIEVTNFITSINESNNKIDAALEYFCYATKEQLFFDGNKRTSFLICNKILLENGIGIFFISPENFDEFNKLLSNHYNYSHIEVKYKDELKSFLNKCIKFDNE